MLRGRVVDRPAEYTPVPPGRRLSARGRPRSPRRRAAPAASSAVAAGRQRRAGRHDVVDEQDPAARTTASPRSRPPGAGTRPRRWSPARRARARTGRSSPVARSSARDRPADPSCPGGDRRDEGRLVVAAPAFALGVDGDRDDERRARPDPRPAPRDGAPERLGQPPLARVLQVVERGPDRPGERRAPLELEERRRDVGRKADRRPAGQREPGVEGRQARGAQRRALAAAPEHDGGEGEIERGRPRAGGAWPSTR